MRHTQQHRRSVYARAAAPRPPQASARPRKHEVHMQANAAVRAAAGAAAHGSITNHIVLRRLSRVCDARTVEIRVAAERRACVSCGVEEQM